MFLYILRSSMLRNKHKGRVLSGWSKLYRVNIDEVRFVDIQASYDSSLEIECCLTCFIPMFNRSLHTKLEFCSFSWWRFRAHSGSDQSTKEVYPPRHLIRHLTCPEACVCPTPNLIFFISFIRLITVHYLHPFHVHFQNRQTLITYVIDND